MATPAVLTSTSALAARQSAGVRSTAFRSGTPVNARPFAVRKAPRTQAVKTIEARAATKQAYICIDCGYIYDGSDGPFDKLPNSYKCPVCNAPKRRFKAYAGTGKNDAKSMKSRMQTMKGSKGSSGSAAVDKEDNNFLLILGAGGAVLLAALYFGLNSQF